MAGKMSPEERRAQIAEWARNTREFEAMYERLRARWRAEDERVSAGGDLSGASFRFVEPPSSP